eukprot:12289939-Alexandrium_andersonii.AAC.1
MSPGTAAISGMPPRSVRAGRRCRSHGSLQSEARTALSARNPGSSWRTVRVTWMPSAPPTTC